MLKLFPWAACGKLKLKLINNLDKFVDSSLTLCFTPHLLWSLTKLVKTAEEFLPDSVLLDLSTQLRKKEEISQFLPFQAPLVIDPFSSSNSYWLRLSHFRFWELGLETIRLRVLKTWLVRNVGCTPGAVNVLIGWAFLWLSLDVALDLGRVGAFAHSLGTLLRIQQVFHYCQEYLPFVSTETWQDIRKKSFFNLK